MSTFQCNFSHEFVYEATGNSKKRARKSTQANVLCGLERDEFDHVVLAFAKRPKSKSGRHVFKLENNIHSLVHSHVNDGKLTIELREPRVNIFIDPSSEMLRVDNDAGKVATPTAAVPQLRSLARKLRKLKRNNKAAKDMLLTWSEDASISDDNNATTTATTASTSTAAATTTARRS
jgi:hypothetical protein